MTRTIAVRTAQVRSQRDQLLISEKGLSHGEGTKARRLAEVRERKAEYLHEVAGLQASYAQVDGPDPVRRLLEHRFDALGDGSSGRSAARS